MGRLVVVFCCWGFNFGVLGWGGGGGGRGGEVRQLNLLQPFFALSITFFSHLHALHANEQQRNSHPFYTHCATFVYTCTLTTHTRVQLCLCMIAYISMHVHANANCICA
uniref:Uncharacterized protein n=1 Tax=Palpitomonas bilix TaxID=652834 RepID=A0A7S3DL12_9EUKA